MASDLSEHAPEPTQQALVRGRATRSDGAARPASTEDEGSVAGLVRAAHATIAVPLRQRGEIVGVMTIVSTERPRHGNTPETALADDLGRRVSAALDNALLFREAQEAIALRDDFLSIASHELKTPLTSQALQIARLRHTLEDGSLCAMPRDRAGTMIDTISRQTERLTRLIDNLLDVSRITAGRLALDLEEVDLRALVREVVERFRSQCEARDVTLSIRADEPVVGRWDRGRLDQVVTNLLTNAIKYGAGRPIEVEVRARPETGGGVLRIIDHGIGIDPSQHRRIFERFERAVSETRGGLGLGLFISAQIVEAHHGTIEVQSRLGEGSVFTVELPRDPEAPLFDEGPPSADLVFGRPRPPTANEDGPAITPGAGLH